MTREQRDSREVREYVAWMRRLCRLRRPVDVHIDDAELPYGWVTSRDEHRAEAMRARSRR